MPEATAKPKRNAPIWLKLVVAFHIVAITSWSIPRAPADLVSGKRKLEVDTSTPFRAVQSSARNFSEGLLLVNDKHFKTSPLRIYLLSSGTWQYWDMFAPNPSNKDIYGTAEITFADGTITTYNYPRIYLLPIPAKYLNERYRKFYERASAESYSYLWPHFANRVAYLSYKDKANPPINVRLIRHWQDIARPGRPQPQEYRQYAYFETAIQPSFLEMLYRD